MSFFDQAKMVHQARKLQKELRSLKIEAERLDGKIKVILNGEGKVEEIKIAEEISSKELENYLKQAINEGMSKVQREAAAKMKEITGNWGLPGL